LEAQLASQAQLIKSLLARISELEEKNAQLEEELSFYRIKKDSSNSSVAPSQDPYREKRTMSLREKSGCKPGGQPGHKGSCLKMSPNPNHVVLHIPGFCTCCGGDLSATPHEFSSKRQVIDIPAVQPVVTEHRVFSKRCSCGHLVEGEYPVEAHTSVCYGPNIVALTGYFHARQYIPYERMSELYRDIFSLPISSGSLVNMVHSLADKSKSIYDEILRRVSISPVVGADETGCRINGKNQWAWVFQTPTATFIHTANSRAKKVIDELFPQGFPKTVLVHDCWRSYFNVQTEDHQICTAHLLRDLKYLDKLYPDHQWIADFTDMLHRALDLKKTMTVGDCYQPFKERVLIEEQLDELLCRDIAAEHKKLLTFRTRVFNYRNYLFTFLHNHKVPPDNNASERSIRTYKVKQKVSGLFRAENGAKAFSVIRSIIDTTIKNAKNVWEALSLISSTPVFIVDDS
jgi:transposase